MSQAKAFVGGFALCAILAGILYVTAVRGKRPAAGDHPEPKKQEEDSREQQIVKLSEAALKAADIKTALVEPQVVGPTITATAIIRPDADRLAHVSPRVQGRVLAMRAVLGSEVGKDDVLLELGTAAADFLKSRVMLEVAELNYKREEELAQKKITSGAEFIKAKGEYLLAQAEHRSAREKLELLGLSNAEIADIEKNGRVMSRFLVRAPIAGVVIEKHASLGEVVDSSDNLFTIADLSTVWIIVDVYQQHLSNIHIGQDVVVTAEGLAGESFVGKVAYVGDVMKEQTRTFEARVEIRNPDRKLKPGMFVRATIRDPHADHVRRARTVPVDAVQRMKDLSVVFVRREAGVFEARYVTLGERFGDVYEVLAGLEAKEEIVVQGSFILKSELQRSLIGYGHAH